MVQNGMKDEQDGMYDYSGLGREGRVYIGSVSRCLILGNTEWYMSHRHLKYGMVPRGSPMQDACDVITESVAQDAKGASDFT